MSGINRASALVEWAFWLGAVAKIFVAGPFNSLGVSIDALYGRAPAKKKLVKQEGDSRLRRRLLAVEKLGASDKRQALQLLDALIERGQLKAKAEGKAQPRAA
jgi:hypothetical protein